jgi:hypothetical protein
MDFLERLAQRFRKGPKVTDPNAHVEEYLKYYLALPDAPNYAVMLTGPWGGGKTYLTKRLMRQLRQVGTKHVYVSLYGIRTREEFDRAVLAALYPFIENKAVKASTQIIGALLSTVRVNTRISIEDYLGKFDADLFVFDDLERADMPIATVLGYINPFVEHGGCKVIILANEAEIKTTEQEDYRRRKEKVVGQTLTLRPDLDSALPKFTDGIARADTRKLLTENASSIRQIAEQSGYGNLRVLQQGLWDFLRFHAALPDNFRIKEKGVTALLAPFLALAIEFRNGKLNRTNLKGRSRWARALATQNKETVPDPFEEVAQKYAGVDLGDTVFSNDLIVEMFEGGTFSTTNIRTDLERSRLFTNPADIPSWRIVWDKEVWADDEAERAIKDMEAKFAARAYVAQGEILHVFGLRLRLADEELLSLKRAELIAEGKAYVDDLERQKRLEPFAIPMHGLDYTSYEGLGFTDKESPEFGELLDYLLNRQQAVLDGSYPAQAQALLAEMAKDDSLFWRRINYSNTSDTRYARIPIFVHVQPKDFVDHLLKLSNYRQRSALMALQTRYDGGRLVKELVLERPWIEQVCDELLARAAASSPIAKIRIKCFVRWTIGKVLNELALVEKEEAEAATAVPVAAPKPAKRSKA